MLYKGVQLDLKYEDVKIEDMLNPNTSSTNISTSKSFNKQDNLKRNVQLLCETLNDAGFRNDGHKWQSGIDPKSTFGGGICFDKSAFNYLKTNGYLDKNICWKCGDEPITKEFSFNIGNDSSIKYNICKNCFKKGKKTQNVIEGKDSANCYIATVCYGDINAPELNILRYFRDNHLKNTNLGSKFVDAYYCASPSIAEFLKNKKVLNLIIKKLILNPIVDFVKRKKTTHNNGYK